MSSISSTPRCTTALYTVLSIFPVIDVANPFDFTVRVGGTVLGINLFGAAYFWYAQRRLRRLLPV